MFRAWRRGTRAVAGVSGRLWHESAYARRARRQDRRAIPSIRSTAADFAFGARRPFKVCTTQTDIRGPRRREVMPAGQSRLVPVAWDDALVALTDRVRMFATKAEPTESRS